MKSLKSPPLSSSGRTAAATTSSLPPDGGLSLARFVAVVGPCALLCLVVLLITPWIGSTPVTWRNVIAGVSPDRKIAPDSLWSNCRRRPGGCGRSVSSHSAKLACDSIHARDLDRQFLWRRGRDLARAGDSGSGRSLRVAGRVCGRIPDD